MVWSVAPRRSGAPPGVELRPEHARGRASCVVCGGSRSRRTRTRAVEHAVETLRHGAYVLQHTKFIHSSTPNPSGLLEYLANSFCAMPYLHYPYALAVKYSGVRPAPMNSLRPWLYCPSPAFTARAASSQSSRGPAWPCFRSRRSASSRLGGRGAEVWPPTCRK